MRDRTPSQDASTERNAAPAERTIDRLQRAHTLGKLVGDAPAFRASIARLPAIARADATVLLNGETGTGKELVARAIHYVSGRRAAAFTAVNCGSLPDTLLEDEFFGHERGAFTDARTTRTGLLRQAHGGTLFLDEVDALSPRGQVSLLRVLQDRTYRALGSSQERYTDMRVIAATNVELWTLVTQKLFRSDLFYRLSVLTMHLPPLRERMTDILPLTHHFVLKLTPRGRGPFRLSANAKDALLGHDWPGNIRELENAVLRAVSLSEDNTITAMDLGIVGPTAARGGDPDVTEPTPTVWEARATLEHQFDLTRSFGELKRETVATFEVEYLRRLMTSCGGNVSRAARKARKERRDLRRLLHKHRLDPRSFEQRA
ncbi:MAG: sigma 54-interacting transcriptional regulator [Gemmatimonadaceae bacterium]